MDCDFDSLIIRFLNFDKANDIEYFKLYLRVKSYIKYRNETGLNKDLRDYLLKKCKAS